MTNMATITTVDPYGEAAFPYCELPDKVLAAFEDNGLSLNGFMSGLGVYDFKIEGCTDAGGDMLHSLRVNEDELGSIAAWRRAFYDMLEAFSPWEEAHKWCDYNGVPTNTPFDDGEDLFYDIKAYRDDVLEAVYNALMSVDKED